MRTDERKGQRTEEGRDIWSLLKSCRWEREKTARNVASAARCLVPSACDASQSHHIRGIIKTPDRTVAPLAVGNESRTKSTFETLQHALKRAKQMYKYGPLFCFFRVKILPTDIHPPSESPNNSKICICTAANTKHLDSS